MRTTIALFLSFEVIMMLTGIIEYMGILQSLFPRWTFAEAFSLGDKFLVYHVILFLIALTMGVLTALPLKTNILSKFLYSLGFLVTYCSTEDAFWFIGRILIGGGTWIKPYEWTCRLFGAVTYPVVIPVYYFAGPLFILIARWIELEFFKREDKLSIKI